ncbi:hypothetical protein XENOCAPTIV_012693 [Xenoophorus captivus]|uniref:Uncharacterized protein n=1 Tax=Xenoophorus captivus TaxID=1517983 RepID=A0ABV0Q5T3_9TELE
MYLLKPKCDILFHSIKEKLLDTGILLPVNMLHLLFTSLPLSKALEGKKVRKQTDGQCPTKQVRLTAGRPPDGGNTAFIALPEEASGQVSQVEGLNERGSVFAHTPIFTHISAFAINLLHYSSAPND